MKSIQCQARARAHTNKQITSDKPTQSYASFLLCPSREVQRAHLDSTKGVGPEDFERADGTEEERKKEKGRGKRQKTDVGRGRQPANLAELQEGSGPPQHSS